jgi:flagellar basal-body rod modification protein FlgD
LRLALLLRRRVVGIACLKKEAKGTRLMDSVSDTLSASSIQTDYLALLVAQLQYQNPLEPMDNSEMASQLAQFSSLQQLESMSQSFADVLTTVNRSYANSLLGKQVTFYAAGGMTSELEQLVGTVGSVFNDVETDETLLGVTVGEGEETKVYTQIHKVKEIQK